ncbi:MAG: putative ABC transport system ATP-binding protein [Gammaproteobacteria bacterium]
MSDLLGEADKDASTALAPSVLVESLAFSYVCGKPIIDIKQWHLHKSEHVFLYGPSGCGKSTLLNLLSGILAPQQGTVNILNTDITALKPSKRDRFRAQHIGVVFQQFNLIPYLSVLDNIRLAIHFANDKADTDRSYKKNARTQERIVSMLQALELPVNCIQQKASELSVGQQQRVAIARALINKPDVLIVDEPTSALDSSAKDAFMKVLIETATKSNAALIFVSHDHSLASHFKRVESLTDINGGPALVNQLDSKT